MNDTGPFFDAIRAGDLELVTRLIDEDESLANTEMEGVTAVLMALYYGQPDICDLLVLRGAKINIFEAAAVGDLERVSELIENQPELINAYAPDGFQPLGLATFFGREEVVRFLLDHLANANSPSRNAMRVMPLHSAAASHQIEIAQLLLDYGADPNAEQAEGFTPLHAAAQNGDLELIRLLLQYGANPLVKDSANRTPADLAREAGMTGALALFES